MNATHIIGCWLVMMLGIAGCISHSESPTITFVLASITGFCGLFSGILIASHKADDKE